MCGAGSLLGFWLRLVLVHAGCGGAAGLGTWLRACGGSAPRDGRFADAVAVPVTRVFSPYVVQAGSACPHACGQGCSYSVQPGW